MNLQDMNNFNLAEEMRLQSIQSIKISDNSLITVSTARELRQEAETVKELKQIYKNSRFGEFFY